MNLGNQKDGDSDSREPAWKKERGGFRREETKYQKNTLTEILWLAIEAEAPILCPPDAKNSLVGEDPDAGKD